MMVSNIRKAYVTPRVFRYALDPCRPPVHAPLARIAGIITARLEHLTLIREISFEFSDLFLEVVVFHPMGY